MAGHCERCGKGIMHGHNVSHAKKRTSRLFKPNLQTLRVPDAGGIKRKMTLCASCVRIVRKEMAAVQKPEVKQAEKEALHE